MSKVAGIGARQTPESVCQVMQRLGALAADRGFVLRTGGAVGADQAFAKGYASRKHDGLEIFIPWEGYNGMRADGRRVICDINAEAMCIASRFYSRWEVSKPAVRYLMARNVQILLGRNLDDPSDLVICWTRKGKIIGGTGHSLRMAERFGIEILNLYGMEQT